MGRELRLELLVHDVNLTVARLTPSSAMASAVAWESMPFMNVSRSAGSKKAATSFPSLIAKLIGVVTVSLLKRSPWVRNPSSHFAALRTAEQN